MAGGKNGLSQKRLARQEVALKIIEKFIEHPTVGQNSRALLTENKTRKPSKLSAKFTNKYRTGFKSET